MRKSFLRFAFMFTALAIVAMSACKSGPKDADLEKAVSEKAAAIGADANGLTATVKDGVVTLSGAFKDDATKAAFLTTVKAIPGVKPDVVDNTIVTPPPPPAPVVVAADDPLTKGVADATKDFPGVKAEVKDGVITVTGEATKTDWKKIKMSLDALHPKKVDAAGLKTK